MATSAVEFEARASDVSTTDDELIVELVDGRRLAVPLAWFPRLLRASPEQRSGWELLGDGLGIHWPDVDEDISVLGLLRGFRARTEGQAEPSAGRRQGDQG
ncbi:MAG: DUF2442 domain-containing protein [Deltaproteobacteria bacterium]|nr:DUF2442 domain-containing protein [Deltaproteobacteria bacterium]MCB9785643.1 DUF2442 domain-containing protein [Deltaproteobacteria bacterium]